MNQARKPQAQDKYILRLKEGMREKIASQAAANGRSMNAEIVLILETALSRNTIQQKSFEELNDLEKLHRLLDEILDAAIPMQSILNNIKTGL